MGLPLALVRLARTRIAFALERAAPESVVKVLALVSQVPKSMSLLVRVTAVPSLVLAAAMAMALFWAWVTLVAMPAAAARAAASAALRSSLLAVCTRP